MNRKEAISVFKEIKEHLQYNNITSIKLIEPANSQSVGFQVRVKANFSEANILQLRNLCAKQNLSMLISDGELVIYKSKQQNFL